MYSESLDSFFAQSWADSPMIDDPFAALFVNCTTMSTTRKTAIRNFVSVVSEFKPAYVVCLFAVTLEYHSQLIQIGNLKPVRCNSGEGGTTYNVPDRKPRPLISRRSNTRSWSSDISFNPAFSMQLTTV